MKTALAIFGQLFTQAESWVALYREHSLYGGRITVPLVSSLTRLDWTKEETILLFVFSEAI